MNYDLIKLLKETDGYVSGQEISKLFGITRASIWKRINSLKEQGYVIEGVSKKGYKLISCPDILVPYEIENNLSTKFIGRNINHFDTLKSTNETAKSLANDAEDGTIVISEQQQGGKGRFNRVWTSPRGGLWFSLILKSNLEPIYASKVTIISAAALLLVLKEKNIDALIKWPNDIYVNGKKLCGILTEMKCNMDVINYLIVGIGINANIPSDYFTDGIEDIATSLKIITGDDINRCLLLASFLNKFEELYTDFIEKHDISAVLDICRKYSMLVNKEAYHITSRGREKVTCLGIDDEGELIVKDSLQNIKSVLSGEISFKKE